MSDRPEDAARISIPLAARVTLARPAVQLIADEAGADLLHIKGDAVDRRLRSVPQTGTDVDALVRPQHVDAMDAGLRAHGWRVYSTFTYGSPFGHAQTYLHATWGYFDLHRLFPGVRLDPAAAFDLLWSERREIELPGARGSVPSVEMQAVLLVLNDARSPGADDSLARWVARPGLDRSAVDECVRALKAHVAFAAATGDLESFRGEPDYRLWRVVTTGGSRVAEWWARIRAADSAAEAVRIAVRAPLVNVEKLEHDLGRRPTPTEIAAAFVGRPARAVREMLRATRTDHR